MSKLRERYHQAVTDAALEPAVMNLTMWDLAITYEKLVADWNSHAVHDDALSHVNLISSFDTVCEYYFGKEAWQRVKEGL